MSRYRHMVAGVVVGWAAVCAGCEEPPGTIDGEEAADDDDAVEPGGQVSAAETIDFGYVPVGEASTVDVEVYNSGEQPLEITVVTITGSEDTVFRADWDGDAVTIPPDTLQVYARIPVTFTPQEAGRHQAWLLVFSSDFNHLPGEPTAIELRGGGIVDGDGDGYYDEASYPEPGADCDDGDAGVHPGAEERCDGVDDDCDGVLREDERDQDGDGFLACGDGDDPLDCDDLDPATHPGAEEVCDGVDNDCDGGLPQDEQDADHDGFAICEGDCDDGDPGLHPSDADGDGYSPCGGDCDDADPGRYPGAPESCNGVDDDCDAVIPDGELDLDGDGASACQGDCDDADAALNIQDLDGDGRSTCDGDCDDADATLNPLDLDGDGWDTCSGDCDDADDARHPGELDVCDGVDNDCDGVVDDPPDADGDGATICDEFPDCDDGDAAVHPAWVDPAALGGQGTRDDPFGSIQDAVDADHCGEVLLAAGTYREGQTVVVSSPVRITSVDGDGLAVVDGESSFTVFHVTAGPTELRGVVITGGWGVEAGGLFAEAEVTLEGCTVEGNVNAPLSWGAGGVRAAGADLVIADSTIALNTSDWSGAVFVEQGDLVLTDTMIWGNVTPDGENPGGGILVAYGDALVDGALIAANAGGSGTAFGAYEAASVEIRDSVLTRNQTERYAPGIELWYVDAALIAGCELSYNTTSAYASALFVWDSAVALEDTVILGNEAGGDTVDAHDSTVTVDRCAFLGNVGDGIDAFYGELRVSNTIFNANAGSAIDVSIGDASIVNCTFFDEDPGAGAGVIRVGSSAGSVLLDSAIVQPASGYGLECDAPVVDRQYTLIDDAAAEGTVSGDCGAAGPGNLESYAVFRLATANGDPADDDLRLESWSAGVDEGNPDAGRNDADGSRNDMGAYGGPTPYGG